MIPNQFLTPRLSVRHWDVELSEPQARRRLTEELAALLTPAVFETLPPPVHLTDQGVPDWIAARRAESEILLVRQSSDAQLIGLLVLAGDFDAGAVPDIHIGYLFAESAWGKGYASELLKGLLSALTSGPSLRLVAGVGRDNPASARVLQKSGFKLWPERSNHSTEMYVREFG